ncbi:imidazole glycerol phosphate synthase subunit HisF (plasmid) [Pseudohalocynthiibacter aestuariivivens]|uniref:Imidazole glycerol phosphate synthase subunit HisF n=1 Tax=Roseovarius pelagicus TaxID=2980108 RepID=A0ABY6D5I4_9RHOB|nr:MULTISPECIES: imidazole glycerol phosphate synthase cyclase subunit [Rhodobacterales]QIE47919.1 imidazole glycerol phosphate synthase subunit HisF [Pseudohalocynthiibacter aestuariivivens]UXX81412.1 imidazole glycerol phosphate synthase cyclase subunit [Roseovarius pelagicus]
MRNLRLIPRLDVKMEWLIKGVQMEGWRKVGDPAEYAKAYADAGADELLFMDVVASLYERNSLHDIVSKVASVVFVPMTVGGGIRTVEDVSAMLACGADKVALNTAATRNPELITDVANRFGAQATVVSIEAIRDKGSWLAMTDNGRNHTGRNVIEWAKEAEERGAGELIITSIDREGLGHGYDLDLIRLVTEQVRIPIVSGGGLGTTDHLSDLIDKTQASAASVAQALHWKKLNMSDLRDTLNANDCFVRRLT